MRCYPNPNQCAIILLQRPSSCSACCQLAPHAVILLRMSPSSFRCVVLANVSLCHCKNLIHLPLGIPPALYPFFYSCSHTGVAFQSPFSTEEQTIFLSAFTINTCCCFYNYLMSSVLCLLVTLIAHLISKVVMFLSCYVISSLSSLLITLIAYPTSQVVIFFSCALATA